MKKLSLKSLFALTTAAALSLSLAGCSTGTAGRRMSFAEEEGIKARKRSKTVGVTEKADAAAAQARQNHQMVCP